MYLIEHVHITRKSKEKHYQLFDDFNEFCDFAIKLSMCSNVQNVECFEVELTKKRNLKTISDFTNQQLEEGISNLRFIRESIPRGKHATERK